MSGLFGGGGQTIASSETPLAGFNIQTSAFGKPVPLLFGRNRISGNLLWYGDFTAIPHTTSSSASGGKGGGGGITTSNTTYTYQTSFALGLNEGPAASINAYWVDKEYHADASVFTKFLGTYSQSAWSYLSSAHPTEALAYRGTAYVAAAAYDLGSSAGLGNHSFDVTGLLPYAAGTIDGADPRDIITALLTSVHYGSGFPIGYLGSWAQYSAWCVASDVFLSPAYETQQEARQAINDLIQLTNAGIFFSEGLLKIVPFSDTAATAHGITYTPNIDPAYELTDDDFLDLEQPVRVMRTPNADAYNQVQIEFLDGASQYNIAIASAQDQASIEIHGLRPMDTIVAHQITDAATARMVAQLILQRAMYTRNVYEFKIGWRYARLEPCDYVTLTDARLELAAVPVRVLSVEEDESGALTINAEDAPAGIHSSPLYTPPGGSGYVVDFSVAPGNVVAPAFFEVPATQALSGLAVGIAVTGNSIDWGGCEIWGSNDGTSYAYVGQVAGGARYGTIGSGITAAVGQAPRVTLVGNGGQILSGSASDAANLSTLALIDNEFVAYTGSALVAANVYDVTLAVRGAHNTVAAAHSGSAPFIRVDDAVAYSDGLDLDMIDKTIYFKFLSYNRYGGGRQQLADVSAYPYTVTGVMAKLAPPSASNVAVTAGVNSVFVTWTNPADMSKVDRTEILRGTTAVLADAVVISSVRGPAGMYSDYVGVGGTTFYYWIRQINKQGYPTAAIGGVSVASIVIDTTIPDGAVTELKLAAAAVTEAKIAANAITAVKIADDAVTAGKIIANAVTAVKIAADAVTADKILASAVTAVKIAAEAVTADKVAANAVTADKILANAVTAAKIAASAVTADKIAAGVVSADKMVAGTITAASAIIANAAIDTLQIKDDAVTIPSSVSGNSITVTTGTYPIGTKLFVLATCNFSYANGSTAYLYLNLDGATVSTRIGYNALANPAFSSGNPGSISCRFTMSSSSHTITLTSSHTAGTPEIIVIGSKK